MSAVLTSRRWVCGRPEPAPGRSHGCFKPIWRLASRFCWFSEEQNLRSGRGLSEPRSNRPESGTTVWGLRRWRGSRQRLFDTHHRVPLRPSRPARWAPPTARCGGLINEYRHAA